MTDTAAPHRRRKPAWSPVITLGSLISWIALLSSVIAGTLYVGRIDAKASTAIDKADAVERARTTDKAEILRTLERMDDKLDDIRKTQDTRLPGQ